MLEEESPTMLGFDVAHYDTLKNEAVKKDIDEKGVEIYRIKNNAG